MYVLPLFLGARGPLLALRDRAQTLEYGSLWPGSGVNGVVFVYVQPVMVLRVLAEERVWQ